MQKLEYNKKRLKFNKPKQRQNNKMMAGDNQLKYDCDHCNVKFNQIITLNVSILNF